MTPPTRNIGAGLTTLSTTDNVLDIDTTLGSATITLPSILAWYELKNKSGAIYDTDGLRFTDVGGVSATNSITFLAAEGDEINGADGILVNTNGISGVITPNLDGASWAYSPVGSASDTSLYTEFGTIQIYVGLLNPYITSLNLVGLEKIYPANGAEAISGNFSMIQGLSMPDITESYGSISFYEAANIAVFSAPKLTTIKGGLSLSFASSLAEINISSLRTAEYVSVNSALITTVDISNLTGTDFLSINSCSLLTSLTIGTALNCSSIDFYGNALTEESVDAILENMDVSEFSQVVMSYDTLVGTFDIGEIVTGGTSGATAVITLNDGTEIIANSVLGVFEVGETITGGTSAATANTTGVTLSSINLTGGTNSTPSAVGLVSKAALEAKGWNITVN